MVVRICDCGEHGRELIMDIIMVVMMMVVVCLYSYTLKKPLPVENSFRKRCVAII